MKKIRVPQIIEKKKNGEKITMITAYDACIANIVDEAGIDMILVGDSLGNVIQGRENTLPVTLDEMIYHTSIVSRGVNYAHISTDMPFLSYQCSKEEAIRNAGLLIKNGKAESVKLEVNESFIETVYAIVKAGIPVISHIGLCPQSIHVMGGYKVQGYSKSEANHIIDLAKMSEEAGAFLLVLESVPYKLAKEITELVKIPTVGIGAGKYCDGQVLVFNDMAGLTAEPLPRFVKKFAEGRKIFLKATKDYISQVKKNSFPKKEHSYE